ncbi:LysR substrate-binding domain-containing protein [Rhizobium sp. LjRoot254]|uniref:LysR substrate-binding domain-containing protein n=1 Tax=Rhizobium sp. LjRoot254 TaxID=3342297 RepID=UPI003ECDD8F9
MNLPPANALRAFEAAARLLSVSRAGDELNVTHAAISHHIRHLEEWFGTKLFRKEGRNVMLTDHGAALSTTLTDSFRQIEAECRSIRRASYPAGLTIACIPSIASRWLIPLLADLQADHANLDLRVIYAKASDRLADFDADVLITLTAGNEAGTTNRKLFSRINRPVASPHYLSRMTGGEPTDIARANLLHDEDTANWTLWFAKAGVLPMPAMKGPIFQDFNLLATSVIAGHGVALCPVEVFAREIAAGDVIVLSDIATMEDESYFVVTQSRTRSEVGAFVDWFIASVRSSASQGT